ncbi:MAG: BspA family leucine-rich repeat surface protein, partial [Lachnospiraceae bacterium]|nr:BspA family leucine-rich repeat surface protein [Lachnospiraceae bacterium]
YTAPETKKLSEILPSGFPSSADSAWVNAGGKKAYKDGDNIKVGNLTLGKDTTVTKSGDNYVCKSGDAAVTFNVKDGAAESITVTGSSGSDGTYAPAAPLVSVTSVFLDKAELSITVGDSDVELIATVLPDNATNKAVTWTSNNTNVATVDDEGNVHAVAAGNATITVTTVDGGKTNTCTVTVTAPSPTEYTVTFDLNGISGTEPTAQTIKDGGKVTKPADPTDTIHTFADWYKTKDATTGMLSDPWDFDNYTVTADMTLYAQWTTIISKIVGTNTGIPTVANFDWSNPATASIPENAWVTDDGKKAFWVPGDNGGFAILHTTVTEDQTIIQVFGLDDTDTFTKVGDTYVLSTAQFTATCTMTDGKFTSLTFAGIDLSALGVMDSSIFDGTYTAPAAPTFKAVYDTTNDANTLTFYYDNKDHSGDNITVYNNLPTAATKQSDWGYGNRSNIKSVVIDSSVAGYDGLTSTAYMFQGMQNAGNISGTGNLNTSKVTNMTGMFYSCKALSSLNLSNFDTSKVTDMTGMFAFCHALSSLDVSGFDTSIVTNMQSMFNNCDELSSLDLSNFETSKVTNMSSMFLNCKKLTALNISSFNTSEVGNMSGMFKDCSALETITFGNSFDTSKVTDMGDMFNGCTKLQSLGLSSFNTSNVTKMTNMFQNCETLTTLDLSSFDTSEVTTMKNMFNGCGSLETIGLDGFTVRNETTVEDMFKDCSKLTSVKIISDENEKIKNALGDGWKYNSGNNAYERLPVSGSPLYKASGTSSDPVNDAPMAETEVSEPTAEVFEPEFEPEKFEEAKPEELIEPAEAVAEEAAP